MTYVTFIVIIIVLLVLLGLNNLIKEYIKDNKKEIQNLQNSLRKIENQLSYKEVTSHEPDVQKVKKEAPASIPAEIKTEEMSYIESILEPYEEEQKTELIKEVPKETPPPPTPKKVVPQEKTYKPSYDEESKPFLERYPDLEKFIGENLINKTRITIPILLIKFSPINFSKSGYLSRNGFDSSS
jgi:Sec-independent protein translocase protein TatA